MRKPTTTSVQRRRLQAKRTRFNARSKEKAATWRRRLPAALAAEKQAKLEAAIKAKQEAEET